MSIEDYKELMMFYLMDVNTSGYYYAAVDSDGGLCIYKKKPVIIVEDTDYNSEIWTPHEEAKNKDMMTSAYDVISLIPIESGIDWKETLVKL